MIITRTPLRISFLGGGTDYPAWVKEYGGLVVGSAIDKFSYITCRRLPPLFDYTTKVVYSQIETVKNNQDIKHKAIRATINCTATEKLDLEIFHMADLPSKTGTGSSSSFVVGLANALMALNNQKLNAYELAKRAIFIEQVYMQENVGYQDQIWAAFGGLNYIVFQKDQTFSVHPINLSSEELSALRNTFMLFFTGVHRNASDIAGTYCRSRQPINHELHRLAWEGITTILRKDFYKLGELMHKSWLLKRSLSSCVTNNEIDCMYQKALDAGAYGGKIIGAGGGGCLLLSVPENKKGDVRNALSNLLEIDFGFELSGSKVIFNDEEK
jgi:D-glycero-alpha-D-manno-heptose-7-phosphate kinase